MNKDKTIEMLQAQKANFIRDLEEQIGHLQALLHRMKNTPIQTE